VRGSPTSLARGKSWSVKEINRTVGRVGPLWQRDYYDRYIRDEGHFLSTIDYIE
jgi:hypothetical protein